MTQELEKKTIHIRYATLISIIIGTATITSSFIWGVSKMEKTFDDNARVQYYQGKHISRIDSTVCLIVSTIDTQDLNRSRKWGALLYCLSEKERAIYFNYLHINSNY